MIANFKTSSPLTLSTCFISTIIAIKPYSHSLIHNMRGLGESTETIRRVSHDAREHVHHAWQGFIDFAARDNVLEVALGLM